MTSLSKLVLCGTGRHQISKEVDDILSDRREPMRMTRCSRCRANLRLILDNSADEGYAEYRIVELR